MYTVPLSTWTVGAVGENFRNLTAEVLYQLIGCLPHDLQRFFQGVVNPRWLFAGFQHQSIYWVVLKMGFWFLYKMIAYILVKISCQNHWCPTKTWGWAAIVWVFFCWCQLLEEFIPMHFPLPCSTRVCLKTSWCRPFSYLISLRFFYSQSRGWLVTYHSYFGGDASCRRESPDAVPNSEWYGSVGSTVPASMEFRDQATWFIVEGRNDLNISGSHGIPMIFGRNVEGFEEKKVGG